MLKQLLDKYLKDYHDEVLQDKDCNINHQNAFAVLRHVNPLDYNLRKELEEVREGFERDFHLNQCLPMENAFLFSCIKIDKLMLELQLRVDSIRSQYGCDEGHWVGYSEQWVKGYLND